MKSIIYHIVTRLAPLWCLLFCLPANALSTLAFERNNAIWVANLDGSQAKKLTEGTDPNISADGTRIAFTISDSKRRIAIFTLSTKKTTYLTNITSDNSFNPVWSPDSKALLFSAFINNEWHLAGINADNTNYRVIANTKDFYAPTWSADGKSFFAQNLTSIVQFSADGKQLKKWDISTLIPKGSMNSSSHMNLAPNGAALIVEADMDEALNYKNWDSAPSALWLIDVNKNTATRLTQTGTLAWHPYWINAEEFVFVSQGAKDQRAALHRGSIKDKPVRVIKNAHSPSVAH